MIIFKKKKEETYLITNYKVMYSTLTSKNNLIRVYPNKKLYYYAILSWFSSSRKFYLVVRNPAKRFISFYKDKFIKTEKARLKRFENEKGNLQRCTSFFYKYLGLDNTMKPDAISNKLINTSIEEAISILPNVYMYDGHYFPQYLARKFPIKRIGLTINIPIKFQETFKIENSNDLAKIGEIFEIDMSVKRNNTDDVKSKFILDDKSFKTLKKVYEKDFRLFDYV